VVSHRASSAKNSNHIIILDEGMILEEGTHSELLANNGYYKDLYNKQLSEKEN
jgi:ATP-binding cassette subfamily B protein